MMRNCVKGKPFLSHHGSLAFILNIDWFQLFKHYMYSIGVMYSAILNLPRDVRYKRENIILLYRTHSRTQGAFIIY